MPSTAAPPRKAAEQGTLADRETKKGLILLATVAGLPERVPGVDAVTVTNAQAIALGDLLGRSVSI